MPGFSNAGESSIALMILKFDSIALMILKFDSGDKCGNRHPQSRLSNPSDFGDSPHRAVARSIAT